MTLEKLLSEFYLKNKIPKNGGIDDNTFQMKVFFINLTLPNPKFRKDLTHIHDIQHILNDCDTSWEGEGFISGWEVATGFWKHFECVSNSPVTFKKRFFFRNKWKTRGKFVAYFHILLIFYFIFCILFFW